MKKLPVMFFFLFAGISFSQAHENLHTGGTGKNNDSTVNMKSNLMIFKMMTPPSAPQPSDNGSLKRAGKVARTSIYHTNRTPTACILHTEG